MTRSLPWSTPSKVAPPRFTHRPRCGSLFGIYIPRSWRPSKLPYCKAFQNCRTRWRHVAWVWQWDPIVPKERLFPLLEFRFLAWMPLIISFLFFVSDCESPPCHSHFHQPCPHKNRLLRVHSSHSPGRVTPRLKRSFIPWVQYSIWNQKIVLVSQFLTTSLHDALRNNDQKTFFKILS